MPSLFKFKNFKKKLQQRKTNLFEGNLENF